MQPAFALESELAVTESTSGRAKTFVYILFFVLIALILLGCLSTLLRIFIDFQYRAVMGRASNGTEFRKILQEENIETTYDLPVKAQKISYFMQPNIHRFYIEFSIDQSDLQVWAEANSAELAEVNSVEVQWIDSGANSTELVVKKGLQGGVIGTPDRIVYDRDLEKCYFWQKGR